VKTPATAWPAEVCTFTLFPSSSLKFPIHVRVWLASPPRGAWLGSQARI
jgi:hypothetical protein